MFRFRWLLASGVTVGLAALTLASTSAARVAHDPCPGRGDFTLTDQLISPRLPDRLRYELHAEYRVCGPEHSIGYGLTVPGAVYCQRGFKLAGTSYAHANDTGARWDFWSRNGEWVTWTGSGEMMWRDGWAHGYGPWLYDHNFIETWQVRVFAICDRIPDYRFQS